MTAMTSPQAATTDVVAAMAAAQVNDAPPPEQQPPPAPTAVNPEQNHAGIDPEHDHGADLEIDEAPSGDMDALHALDGMVPIEGQHYMSQPPDAAIPEGADLSQDTQSGYGPTTSTSIDQIIAFNTLMGLQPTDNPMALYYANSGVPMANAMGMTLSADPDPYLDPSPDIHGLDQTRISAYAKLEFDDGEFYMNTYSIILGRDILAAKAAQRRELQAVKKELNAQAQAAGDPKTPTRVKTQGSRFSRSAISESGGILRDGDDSNSDSRARRRDRRNRKASKKTKSTGSSVRQPSRRNSLVMPNGRIQYQPQPQTRRTAPDTVGAVPVDPASLRPSPNDCPVIGIHPPGDVAASGYKAISREHVKIAFNSHKSLFEAIIIGRNGAFIDEVFYHHEEVIALKSGSILQIGGVVVKFILPDVAIGETGAENHGEYDDGQDLAPDRYSEGGKEMSFDFEETARVGALNVDTSEEASEDDEDHDVKRDPAALESFEDPNAGDDEEEEADDYPDIEDYGEDDAEGEDEFDTNGYGLRLSVEDQDSQDETQGDNKPQLQANDEAKPQKKRGPGRPPKNGIMSKREQQLAKKEALAQEKAKNAVPQQSETGKESLEGKEPKEGKDGKVKNKVGRPRKHPRPDTPPNKPEKRKYTKRKPKDPNDPSAKQDGSGEEKKPKKEKAPKPPRSPSPTFNIDELTPEQLAKPQANYVTLIYEALSASAAGQMSLPQIYRAIMRKYPFFVLKCNTNGWQSSVRHNLSQHHAFKKVERDGKGWMWAIVDGVSIEKEKKRRSPPPPPPHHYPQQIFSGPPPPGYMPYGPGMMGPPGYQMAPMPQYQPGQPPPHYMQGPPQMNGYPQPPPGHMHAPPPGFIAPIPAQLTPGTAGGGTYSSPYAPKPTTAMSPPSTDSQPQSSHPPQSLHPPQSYPQPPSQAQPQQHMHAQSQAQTQAQRQNGAPQAQMHPQGQQQQTQETQQPTNQAPVTAPTSTAPPSQPSNPASAVQTVSQGHVPAHLNNTSSVQARPLDQPVNQSQSVQPTQNPAPIQNNMQAPSPVQAPPPSSQMQQHTAMPQQAQNAQYAQQAQHTQQVQQVPSSPASTKNNETLLLVVNNFKTLLVTSLKQKNEHAEAIVDRAIARVLGTAKSGTPGDPQEDYIMNAFSEMLAKLPGINFKPTQPSIVSSRSSQQPPSPQTAAATPSAQEKVGPTVARPSFASQGQSRPSVPRPPMTTSGIKRTESASPAAPRPGTASSASPAPTPSSTATVTNTPTIAPVVDASPLTGQKRALEDSEDHQDFKRLATSGPPQLKT
ncbi:Forkhead box protein K2 [Phlyctema vagabunda]|uniref:Forkhead box protein K2 n=1 Tax=Phlyctema vagabunda TaxID=108571 RepID=A0ABR4PMC3_9HELO